MNDKNDLDHVSIPTCAPRMAAQQEKKQKKLKIMRTVCEILIVIGATIILLMVMLTHIANDGIRKRKEKRGNTNGN